MARQVPGSSASSCVQPSTPRMAAREAVAGGFPWQLIPWLCDPPAAGRRRPPRSNEGSPVQEQNARAFWQASPRAPTSCLSEPSTRFQEAWGGARRQGLCQKRQRSRVNPSLRQQGAFAATELPSKQGWAMLGSEDIEQPTLALRALAVWSRQQQECDTARR